MHNEFNLTINIDKLISLPTYEDKAQGYYLTESNRDGNITYTRMNVDNLGQVQN